MKKWIVCLLAIVVSGFTVFAQDGKKEHKGKNYDQVIAADQVPPVIQNFIQDYLEGQPIIKAKLQSNNVYEIKLADGIEVKFHSDGEWHHIESDNNKPLSKVVLGLLPTDILNYLNAHYKGVAVSEISKCTQGYEVEVETTPKSKDLMFTTDGKFLKAED